MGRHLERTNKRRRQHDRPHSERQGDAWTNNGFPRATPSGSASGKTVKLNDNNGWKATMTLQSDGKARITAAGIGKDGKPAKNTAVLRKQ